VFEQKEYIKLINVMISESEDDELRDLLPISDENIKNNQILCETIIDYLGDIYVSVGLDEQYCETEYGKIISQMIDYLVRCNA